jgi:hypothetical protein
LFDLSENIIYLLFIKHNKSILKKQTMKKVIFGTVLVLGTILTSCGTVTKTEETKTTEDSTKVDATTVTIPSVDSVKVEETKPEGK